MIGWGTSGDRGESHREADVDGLVVGEVVASLDLEGRGEVALPATTTVAVQPPSAASSSEVTVAGWPSSDTSVVTSSTSDSACCPPAVERNEPGERRRSTTYQAEPLSVTQPSPAT